MSSFVFIDSRVADIERLIAGLAPDTQIVILDPALDGVTQIAEALVGVTDLDSIHIVSHGASGTLYLGSTVLIEDNLDDYEGELAQIGEALSEDGDLLLYGCKVGAGTTGEDFIASLADYTGADVAASDDATGSAALGGDWQLEATVGAVETGVAITAATQDAYGFALDTITGTDGSDTLSGTAGSDLIEGRASSDWLIGGDGNDTLDGGTSADSMIGGTGHDRYIIDNNGDIAVEAPGEGSDWVVSYESIGSLPANIENVTYIGPAGGGVFGNELDNVITGNALDNTMGGNDGVDTVSYAYETGPVVIDIDPFTGFATGSGNDTLFTFENAAGGSGADDITGNDLDNRLNGNGGADTMAGGTGNDTYVVDSALDAVTEATTGGTDLIQSSVSIAALAPYVEKLMLTGSANLNGTGNTLANTLTGNTGGNSLNGGTGNDTVSGGGGDDTLEGGRGADSMEGGDGGDLYYVDNAGDDVFEPDPAALALGPAALANPIDIVRATINYTLTANVENLVLTGSATIGTGNALGNVLTGNGLANLLSGVGGNDTLNGGAGNDVLSGGTGIDTVSYQGGASSGVTVSLAITNSQATGGAGSDTLSAVERLTGSTYADQLTGNTGSNVLTGLGGNDRLSGGGGNDTLIGGTGKDTLTGGTGQDRFVFDAVLNATTNVDQITDFSAGVDEMRLDEDIFTALAVGNLAAGAFHAGTVNVASEANDRIIYNTGTGALYYDADGAGGAAATRFATLTGSPVIDDSDFFVVA